MKLMGFFNVALTDLQTTDVFALTFNCNKSYTKAGLSVLVIGSLRCPAQPQIQLYIFISSKNGAVQIECFVF